MWVWVSVKNISVKAGLWRHKHKTASADSTPSPPLSLDNSFLSFSLTAASQGKGVATTVLACQLYPTDGCSHVTLAPIFKTHSKFYTGQEWGNFKQPVA